MRIAILGAGAWGTALGQHAAIAHPVRLWTRDPLHAQAMQRERANARYLPGVALRAPIEADSDLGETLDWAGELGVELPIVGAVQAVLDGALGARDAVLSLLAREPKREH